MSNLLDLSEKRSGSIRDSMRELDGAFKRAEKIEEDLNQLSQQTREAAHTQENDIVGQLVMEHVQMRSMYVEYMALNDVVVKQDKAKKLIKLMCEHTGREELEVYPAMARKLADSDQKELVHHSLDDHQLLAEDLYKLDGMKVASDPAAYDEQLTKTFQHLLKHMLEEESGLPAFASRCSSRELIQLARDFNHALAATHPHPKVPRSGMTAKLAHLLAWPIDSIRDAVSGVNKEPVEQKVEKKGIEEEKRPEIQAGKAEVQTQH